MTINDHSLPHLSGAAAGLGYVVARPRIVAIASIIGLTVLGWLWLGMIAVRQPDLWQALCSAAPAATLAEAAPLLAMWGAMTLAMMIPGAAPMILTYAEIADTAARQRQHVVSPLILAAGYVTVWIGFAGVATLMQIGLAQFGVAEGFSTPLGRAGAGAAFIVAGLYQFSSLKDACLRLCRQPFQFFFTNWATTPGGVFKLGLRQGAHCLGCCWAMMLTMLGIGAMNVIWMAVLAIAMTIEKMSGPRVSQALGIALLVAGAGFVLSIFWTL